MVQTSMLKFSHDEINSLVIKFTSLICGNFCGEPNIGIHIWRIFLTIIFFSLPLMTQNAQNLVK